MSVSPETSAIELPMPMSPNSKIADDRRGPQAEDDQRNAQEDDPEHEGRAESSCAGQRESDYRSDERADSDRRVEDADPAGSEAEELDRRDDDEHLYGAGERSLRRDEADHHAQGRLRADRAEAG